MWFSRPKTTPTNIIEEPKSYLDRAVNIIWRDTLGERQREMLMREAKNMVAEDKAQSFVAYAISETLFKLVQSSYPNSTVTTPDDERKIYKVIYDELQGDRNSEIGGRILGQMRALKNQEPDIAKREGRAV